MDTEHLTVLFIEDSEADAKLAVRELTQEGYAVDWTRVDNADTLRVTLASQSFRLVIADSSLPSFDAIAALAIVKEQAPDAAFIAVSGTMRQPMAAAAIRAGADGYIPKDQLHWLGPLVARELRRRRKPTFAQQILAAREDEARRIARELHDGFGQMLTALRLKLVAARGDSDASPDPRAARIGEALAIADQAILKVRDFAGELWPSVLDDAGLEPALRWLADRHTRWFQQAVDLDLAAIRRVDRAIEVAAFRIAQEALTNIARHASSSRTAIRLAANGDTFELVIVDDGIAFDVEAALRRAGSGGSLGLLAMRERAAGAGGTVAIESAPGRGTTVRVRLPLEPA